ASLDVNARVVAAALGATLLTAIACGLGPALRASRLDPARLLGDGARTGVSRGHRRTRDALVSFQIVLSLVLLVGAGLLVRSFGALLSTDAGLDVDHTLVLEVSLPPRYDEAAQTRFFDELTRRISALPGVAAVGATAVDPFSGWNLMNDVTPEGRVADAPPSGYMQAGWRSVTPSLFGALGIRLLAGRAFTADDRAGAAHVAIVSRGLASALWPGESAIGKRLYWGGTHGTPRTVVGVVGDVRDVAPERPVEPMLYVPEAQVPMPGMAVVVRAAGDPTPLVAAVRDAVRAQDPLLPLGEIHRLGRNRVEAMTAPRLRLELMSVFALLALVLAASGIYAMVAFNVAQRTREIGIRIALGASPAGVVAAFVRSSLSRSVAGIGVGLAAAWVLAHSLAGLLYGITPSDALTFVLAPIMLVAVSLAATYVPARRAARVSPIEALRTD
ncbi:MAG TPA: FtsX-like permease family protein, partial [Gemmatimonadaceae bacterium]|nr:FtsX-like permease family protein [Gemmatimonadaceae bacterium]